MGKKTIVVALTILFLSSASYALDPLGPPKAVLNQGQWSPSLEYAYSEMRVELDNDTPAGTVFQGKSTDVRASKAYANLRYGLWGNVDLFGRAGLASFEAPELSQDGDADFAWGVGAAATLRDTEKLDWGALIQYGRGKSETRTGFPIPGESEIEAWSLQVAGGPTYQLCDEMAVFGGLFYNLFDGELERDEPAFEADLEEENPFGVFAGLDWALKENAHLAFEVQYAGSTYAVAAGLRWFLK